MKNVLLIVICCLAFTAVRSQNKNIESDILKVANVSIYSDTLKYEFGNPVKINGNYKSVFVAGTLSILAPGVGQFYNGDEVGGTVFLMLNALAKTWLFFPPTDHLLAAVPTGRKDYTIPIIANVVVTLVTTINAVKMSEKINHARGFSHLVRKKQVKVSPTVMSSGTNAFDYRPQHLTCGLNFSIKF